MSPFILSFFNSISFAIYCYLVGSILLRKQKIDLKKIITAFIPFLIMYYCILCLLDSIYSIFFSGICWFWFIRVIFKENIFMSLFISLIIHISKIAFKIIIITVLQDNSLCLIHTYKTLDINGFYLNIVAMILSIVLVIIFKKKLKKFIKYVSKLKHREKILLLTIYINFILVLLFICT